MFAAAFLALLLLGLGAAPLAAADHIGGAPHTPPLTKPSLAFPRDAPCVAAPGLEVLCTVLGAVLGLEPRSASPVPVQVQCISLWPWGSICQALLL
jgi:hypothetical protein